MHDLFPVVQRFSLHNKDRGIAIADIQEHCPMTTTLKNGKITFQSRGGITAIFSCDSGYTLHGNNVSHCQTDGHWSSSLPSCISNEQKCSSNIEILDLTPGETVNISCPVDKTETENHYFWTGNGKLIEPLLYKKDSLEISIRNSGLYVCLSQNQMEVNILKAVKVSPKISTKNNLDMCKTSNLNQSIFINATVESETVLSCEAESNPISISWFKNDVQILNGNSSYTKQFLNISSMQSIHEGNYSCLVYQLGDNCVFQKSFIVRMVNVSTKQNYACGQPIVERQKRVIDGSRAVSSSAPWMGMLSRNREPPFCGCSLISEKWIVTAAHCFQSNNKAYFISQEEIKATIFVKFGKYVRRQSEKGELIRNIQELVMHPGFKTNLNSDLYVNEHDIALGKLNESVIFQKHVLPICLPPSGFTASVPTGTLGIVTGWGKVSVQDSIMALTLQEAFLPLVNNSSCQKTSNYMITDNMLCAGYAESFRPDTCSGDSGGPFILQKSNVWYLAGVVSWGEGCSTPKKFGIYTRVENYVPWIQSIVYKH